MAISLQLQVFNLKSHLPLFNVGEIMMGKTEYLMISGAFPDKETPDIDFTDEAVDKWDVLFVKIRFLNNDNLQMIQMTINLDVNT